MADIRPPNWPAAGAPGSNAPSRALVPQQGTGSARAEAQRAFFQAALTGQGVEAPRAAQAPVVAQAAASSANQSGRRAPDLTIDLPEEKPEKLLRPGSIIDIWV
jgi:hypothetical protein